MSDLISRQAATDAINEIIRMEHSLRPKVYVAKDAIKALPSAHPEPKRGQWVLDRSGEYCCSECMEPCAGYVMMKPRDKFCKMCGAKMEVEHE